MIDAVKPYLDLAAGITQATVAKAVESAQGIIARNAPGSDLLDQAQIGSLGLVSVNLGTDQHFQDDSGPEVAEAATDEATTTAKAKGKGKKKSKKKGKQAAAEDTSGSDVLDQAQIGSMGLLSINLGGRQRLVDDEGGDVAVTATTMAAEIAALRADVTALAEALVAIGAVELEHMETLPRRGARKARARRRSTRKAPAAKALARKSPGRRASARKAAAPSTTAAAAPAKKAPAKKAPVKKAPAKKAPVRKAPAKKAPAKKAPAKKAPVRKAPAKKAAARKAPARRRATADD